MSVSLRADRGDGSGVVCIYSSRESERIEVSNKKDRKLQKKMLVEYFNARSSSGMWVYLALLPGTRGHDGEVQ